MIHRFYVCQDTASEEAPQIHRGGCARCIGQSCGQFGGGTFLWHWFDTYQEARTFARSVSDRAIDCKHCRPDIWIQSAPKSCRQIGDQAR